MGILSIETPFFESKKSPTGPTKKRTPKKLENLATSFFRWFVGIRSLSIFRWIEKNMWEVNSDEYDEYLHFFLG